ncbi:retrovirus-related Pol polyprotein from transposon 412 [Trichonephila clavipes]|nr:retrovirus-related Pol polyprotein from transposon 412 [Trichonephila clavipes]
MLFGRDLRLPADLLFSRPPDAPLEPEEYIEKYQARMEEMHHLARERIGMASEEMKTQYGAREQPDTTSTKATKCGYGIRNVAKLSPKLQTNLEGPYAVLKRLNDVVAWIQKSPHSKLKWRIIHKPPQRKTFRELKPEERQIRPRDRSSPSNSPLEKWLRTAVEKCAGAPSVAGAANPTIPRLPHRSPDLR